MVWRPDRRKLALGALAAGLTALATWIGGGLHPVWWLTWLAPLPVLWLAPRVGWGGAGLAAFAGAAAGGLNQWGYLHGRIGLPLPVVVSAIVAPALGLALCALLHRRMLRRGSALAAALVVPACWIALEYANTVLSPHGTFGAIAYTQVDALPLLQLAAVTGLWGMGFLVRLFPAAVAAASAPGRLGRRWTPLALTAVMLASTLGYGAWRLAQPATGSVRIGLVSIQDVVRPPLASPEGQVLLRRYLSAAERLADRGARTVVFPETVFATAEADVPALADLARRRGLVIDVGIDDRSRPADERNVAMVFQPAGGAPTIYAKHHLIPGFEDQYRPGTRYRRLAWEPGVGLAVCKDMDFQDVGQAYAELGAQLLLVPAWDFVVDGWLHGRMAVLRGVESGFAVARAARSGRLTLSDDRGRVIAEASSERRSAELVADLPLHAGRTLYSRWGDWFARGDLALLVALLILAYRPQAPPAGV